MKHYKKLTQSERLIVLILSITIACLFVAMLINFLNSYQSCSPGMRGEMSFAAIIYYYMVAVYGGAAICLILTFLKKMHLMKYVIIFDAIGLVITIFILNLPDPIILNIIHFLRL